MNNNLRQALTEVLQVLNNTQKDLIALIPQDFVIFLLDNHDQKYKPNIDFSLDNWETMISDDAKSIIAYIYKEFLVTEEEGAELLTDEELVKKGEEMLQKYGLEDLFEDKENVATASTIANVPMPLPKQPWYKKVLQKIMNLFK